MIFCDLKKINFDVGFSLICFQRLYLLNVATQQCFRKTTGTPLVHSPQSSRTKGKSSQFSKPIEDRDQTVSRRSKPNSRTTLIGEQPNPWELLHPRDVMSRHRGAKRFRRYELLGIISLLSLAYLLSVERWPYHTVPPDHYGRLSSLFEMSLLQSSRLIPLHSKID